MTKTKYSRSPVKYYKPYNNQRNVMYKGRGSYKTILRKATNTAKQVVNTAKNIYNNPAGRLATHAGLYLASAAVPELAPAIMMGHRIATSSNPVQTAYNLYRNSR